MITDMHDIHQRDDGSCEEIKITPKKHTRWNITGLCGTTLFNNGLECGQMNKVNPDSESQNSSICADKLNETQKGDEIEIAKERVG